MEASEALDRAEHNVRKLSEDPNLEKFRQRESKRQQKAERISDGAVLKSHEAEMGKQPVDAKVEQTPAPNVSADPSLQQAEVKGSDLHPLLSSWSSHRLEWIIGSTQAPSQAPQQTCAIKTDRIPASDTATVPPSRSPKQADTNENDLHHLLARTPTHHSEWIIGNPAFKEQTKQAADQSVAAKTEQPLKSERVLQTEHVNDAKALTPPPKAEYCVEQTQSDDTVTADGISDTTKTDIRTPRMLPVESPAEKRKPKSLSREVFAYDEAPTGDQEVITPTTVKSELALKRQKAARRKSNLKTHRAGHPRLTGDRMTERVSSGSDPEVMVARRRKHKRWRSAVDHRPGSSLSRSLMRFRSCRIRARRKRRPLYVDPATRIRPTEEAIADDRVIELTPLKSPISIDSIQRLTRNGDQLNFRQPSKRGRVGSWIFTPSRAMQKAPIVFGITKIVEERGIAPFCISIAAPFWVTCHQEQTCSSQKGERIRESIEIRQCDGSGMPCYEMKALDQSQHPLFNEHIYLGRGVIRIDRSSYIPTEEKK
ncbi:hypothetical protein GCK32_006954, partial [Trichostrongylus colubriformis]